MKSTSTTKMPDTSDDAPKLAQADFDRARLRVAGKDASRAEWQSSVRIRIGCMYRIDTSDPDMCHKKPQHAERVGVSGT